MQHLQKSLSSPLSPYFFQICPQKTQFLQTIIFIFMTFLLFGLANIRGRASMGSEKQKRGFRKKTKKCKKTTVIVKNYSEFKKTLAISP